MARVPSAVFAATYLMLIPGFAVVYNGMPGQFFHLTVTMERELGGGTLDPS